MKLSVIIPAYNEEQRIKPTLESVCEYLDKKNYEYEIIVVDDGSTDSTQNVVEAVIQNGSKAVRLITNQENKGKGAVVKHGMLEAKGELRLFMDADNSTNIDQVENLIKGIDEGFDIAIGSRRVSGAQIAVHQSWIKEKLGQLANLWIRFWAVSGIYDTQAGFKLFTAKAVEIVFPKMTLNRWGFDFELLAIAKQNNLKIKEVPIVWYNDNRSKVSSISYLWTFFEAKKVWFNKILGRYNQ